MPTQRVTVTNFDNWGKLIKSWSTGTNRFGRRFPGNESVPLDNTAPIPRPTSIAELVAQCSWANVGITIPPTVVGLEFIEPNPSILKLRLPPGQMIQESETAIRANPQGYPLPKFYDRFYDKTLVFVETATALDFHDHRIGDYTISNCA